ncbi:MAG: hypothetical protein ACJ746_26925 [Bryobacteraceae bacterium]
MLKDAQLPADPPDQTLAESGAPHVTVTGAPYRRAEAIVSNAAGTRDFIRLNSLNPSLRLISAHSYKPRGVSGTGKDLGV